VGAPSARPKPSSGRLHREATLAKSPYQPTVSQAHSMRRSPDTLSSHARLSRQGRSDHSHFALSLTDLTGKQRCSPRSDCCATHRGKTDNSQVQPRAQQEARPRPTWGLDRPCHRGYIMTLPLASSGYEGTRPASHLARPGNR
jgi:hypothetical protein